MSKLYQATSLVALIATLATVAPSAAQQAAPTELVVQANEFESADGQAMFVLVSSAEAFEQMREDDQDRTALQGQLAVAHSPIENGAAAVRFTDVVPGEYAVMVIHDANSNQKLDKKPGRFGRMAPAEDLGVTNDYRPSFPPRPPRWDDVKIAVAPGANRASVTMGMTRGMLR